MIRSPIGSMPGFSLRSPIAIDIAAIWTPAQLFANGEQGVWYEPKPEYLYQDASGTTPVTADGDPVGYMQDLSGNGNHATQSTSAARPIYRTDGTLHWLEFDGVDDTLNSFLDPILSKTSPFFISMAATSDQTGFDRLLSIGAGSEEAIQILTQTDGYRAVLEINSTGINHGVKGRIAGMDVFTFGSDGDDTYITRIGGEVVANETDGGDALTGSAGVLTLGARNPSGQSACNMTFTGALMVQRSNGFKQAEPYLASLAGVTL